MNPSLKASRFSGLRYTVNLQKKSADSLAVTCWAEGLILGALCFSCRVTTGLHARSLLETYEEHPVASLLGMQDIKCKLVKLLTGD